MTGSSKSAWSAVCSTREVWQWRGVTFEIDPRSDSTRFVQFAKSLVVVHFWQGWFNEVVAEPSTASFRQFA